MNFDRLTTHIKTWRYPYLLILFLVATTFPLLKRLVVDWLNDDNYSHGLLVIPVSIYLFWSRRGQLRFPAPPTRWGILLVLLGCCGLILGVAASERFTTRFSLVLIVTGIGLHYLGNANFRKVWFSFFFLLFMIPIPAIIYYSATVPMQLLASQITDSILQVLGVPSVRAGNIIILPEYRLEVAEACSGLRSLVTLMALGALYANMFLTGKVGPMLLFVATVPIAIVANIFRVTATAIGAYAISTELAEEFLHEISGLMVFVSALVIIIILGAIIRWTASRFS